jgi:hypothetical protein
MSPLQRLIDVSHTVEHGMITYKGFPAPIICDWLSRDASRTKYASGTEFQIGKIEMIANTGTYVDSPFHRYENGKDLSELPLESLANLECVVVPVDPRAGAAIDRIPLSASEVGGRAVLFFTGWDRHWGTDAYFEGHPYLTSARRIGWRRPERRSSGSTRSTSTAWPPGSDRCIRYFSEARSRSWSIYAGWPPFRQPAAGSSPCR